MPLLSNRTEQRRNLWKSWPWWLLTLLAVPAVWHVVHFPDDVDHEYPRVVRPTFNPLPPPAYRLAEPGDTIDRVGIYVAAVALVLSIRGLAFSRLDRRRWVAALAVSCAGFWYVANPGPCFDGWHGLGWGAIGNPTAPAGLRLALTVAAGLVVGLVAYGVWPDRIVGLWRLGKANRVAGLGVVAIVLTVLRVAEAPRIEPLGYWPRWAFVAALVAFSALLLRVLPRVNRNARLIVLRTTMAGAAWYALVLGGIGLTWYHRPLERLREVVPGRIYISAMPTYRGLEIAHRRHAFKTIVNLFPEDTPLRSPRLPEELRFVSEHGLRYVGSPSDPASSNAFLDQTLELARDPNAWPILVHCHGCMDRTPAWVGIYEFVVEGKPLLGSLQFIERHRGYRPKASVTLLYSRVLPRLAPERFASDPTAALLRSFARNTWFRPGDGFVSQKAARTASGRLSAVPRRDGGSVPNLTPRR